MNPSPCETTSGEAQVLSGETVLVTGAASGIGEACVRQFAGQGAWVFAVDRDEFALRELAAEVPCQPIACDLNDSERVRDLPDADILVNNAGFQHVSPIEDFPVEIFTKMLQVMVTASFQLVQQSLPRMYDRGWGRIINISSIHGHRASPFKSGYVSAKHALEGLTKVVALEAGHRGVTANSISPSYVRTPLVAKQVSEQALHHGLDEDEVLAEVFLKQTVIKRLIEPEEVARMASFLCTPMAGYLNGTSIHLDGGWTAR